MSVIPEEYKSRVLKDAYCMPSSRHFSVEKTFDTVAREYYWRGVDHDVYEYVHSCDSQPANNVSVLKQHSSMHGVSWDPVS